MDSTDMIHVVGLTKEFGARKAIDNLTFNAEKGEVVGFLGPNGAGKTTTMRILTGYMPPTSGSVTVAGYDVVEQSLQVRSRVGYLPESVPLYTEMTVYDYLKFMADLRKLPDAEDRIEDVLERVNMEDRADGYIAKLSKGMRQRVGLAQALLHSPDVLILDEPTIGLDPVQIKEVRGLIREVGKERTVLLSTHILSEVQQLCDRVLIINKGKIVAEDSPERLQSRLSGEQRVVVRVAGDPQALLPVLEGIEGMSRVRLLEDKGIEFESPAGSDLRPAVARQVIHAGFDLLEMRAVGMSLEDIFLQLTQEEASLEPAPEDSVEEIEAA